MHADEAPMRLTGMHGGVGKQERYGLAGLTSCSTQTATAHSLRFVEDNDVSHDSQP